MVRGQNNFSLHFVHALHLVVHVRHVNFSHLVEQLMQGIFQIMI